MGFGFGALDVATRCEALVTQHAQGFHLRALTRAFAEFQNLHIARTGFAVFVQGLFFGHRRAPEHNQLANVLNRCGVKFIGQAGKHLFAGSAVIGKNPDFDQAVRVQGGVNFFLDVGRQTVAADHDHRIQVVRFGPVDFALGRCELDEGHEGIIPV